MNAEEIFLAAAERQTPDERAAYLDAACAQDPALRAQVEELLRALDGAGSFLEQPVFDPAPTLDAAPPGNEQPARVIGPYQLLRRIGEGGMGTVYLAQQTEPVRRLVA